ncbi:MAG: nucleotide sugar dehydrogenase [Nitriliruptoraceae bacterium]
MSELVAKLADRSARVAVLGQGYVGLVVAMRASEAGFDVVGLEVNPQRAAQLAAGTSYIEDVPDEVLAAALGRGYRPTSDPADLAGFDVAVISVPTPLRDGLPDLEFIESAGRTAGEFLSPGALVVLESTTYPGTTEELLQPILEQASGLSAPEGFLLGYSPERIDPGNPAWGLANTPKIVSGIDAASTAAVDAFFSAFVADTVPVSGCGEAELAKVIENTFRHVNIALVNELAMFASDLGIDVNEAIDAASTKPFGFMPFRPGPGVGGHCLPIDPSYLSWKVRMSLGESFRFIELANDINEHMPQYVVRRVAAALNLDRKAVNGSRIVVLGLAYKPGVGDMRESPAVAIADQLVALGADLVAVEPFAHDTSEIAHLDVVTSIDTAGLSAADLVLLVTDHDEFDYAELVTTAPLVLDTRNRLADPTLPSPVGRVERL